MRWMLSCLLLVVLAGPVQAQLPPALTGELLPGGTLVQRATYASSTTLIDRPTVDVAWSSRDGGAPSLFALLKRRSGLDVSDRLVQLDSADTGLLANAPQLTYTVRATALQAAVAHDLLLVTRGTQAAVDVYRVPPDGLPSLQQTLDPLGHVAAGESSFRWDIPNTVLSADGVFVYFAVPAEDRVYGYRIADGALVFSATVATAPQQVALNADGSVLAVAVEELTESAAGLAWFDVDAPALEQMPRGTFAFPAGDVDERHRLAFAADADVVYVPAGDAQTTYAVDANAAGATSTPLARYDIDGKAQTLAVSDDGTRLAVLQPTTVTTDPGGELISLASGCVYLYDVTPQTGGLSLRATFASPAALPFRDGVVQLTPGGRWLVGYTYVEQDAVFVVDAQQTGQHSDVVSTVALPADIQTMGLSPDGSLIGVGLLAPLTAPLYATALVQLAPEADANGDGILNEADLAGLLSDPQDFALDVVPSPADWLVLSRRWGRAPVDGR